MFKNFREKYSWLDWPNWIVWPLIFGFFLGVCLHRMDPDFGWHIAAGRDILAHGIPSHDIFTFTAPNFAWINVEWLNDVIFAKLYSLGGYGLLSLVFSLLWTLALALVAGTDPRKTRQVSAPIVFAGAILFATFLGVRTEVWMVLGIAITLEILRFSRVNLRWLLLPIFLIWAQLHGSWPAALALMGWWAIFRENSARARRKLWLIIVLCFLITLANPYGPSAYFVILQTAFDPALKTTIGEWMPFWLSVSKGIVAYLVITATAFLLFFAGLSDFAKKSPAKLPRNFFAKIWQKIPPAKRQIFREPMWPFLLASISATRYWPLFVLASIREIDQIFRETLTKIPRRPKRSVKLILGGIATVFAALFAFGFMDSGFSLSKPLDPENVPLASAVRYFRENPCAGNLFNSYNFGGYLIWRLPEQKVFIDGRMPSWTTNGALFGPTYMTEYNRMARDADLLRTNFAKYNITCAVIDKNPIADKQLITEIRELPRWRTVMDEPGFVVLREE